MKRIIILLLSILVVMSAGSLAGVLAGAQAGQPGAQDQPTGPSLKADGSKWRLAYLQGGEYKDYLPVTISVLRGLMDLGWLKATDLPDIPAEQGTPALWKWLSENEVSDYLEFVADGYYSGTWDKKTRELLKEKVISRLNDKKDIDLILALGTWAGQDLANNQHTTPTMVLSSSDPLASNIVKSVEDSGYDHLWARLDPTRYERQVNLFYDIIGFKKLGVVFEDTPEGRSYCSFDRIEKVAKERGFSLVTCNAPFSGVETAREASVGVARCHEELGSKVDALYVTHHRGVEPATMEKINAPLLKYQIPSFSQAGSQEVRYGLLMSISQANFRYVGTFYAETLAKILNGASPRSLEQVFESPPKIAINLATAEAIGYDPGVDILMAADEIFEQIETYAKEEN